MKKIILITIGLILLCTGCSMPNQTVENKINVVCTVFPQYDFVREIAKDRVNVQMLLPPGGEAHSYEPSPKDIIALKEADLFIAIGGESEHWAMHLLEGSELKGTPTLLLADVVTTYAEEVTEGMEGSGHGHEHSEKCDHDEHEAEFDEHIWTAPQNAVLMCRAISKALCEADPENTEFYQNNTDVYCNRLTDLDSEFKKAADDAKRNTVIFGDRFPMRYLIEAMGLQYYAAFPGCSSKTEPSAKTLAFLTDKVKNDNIPVVFYMDYSDARIADAISRETHAKAIRLYSCHNLSKEDLSEGETYLSLMQKNLSALKEALN